MSIFDEEVDLEDTGSAEKEKPKPAAKKPRAKKKAWADVKDENLPVDAQSGVLQGTVRRYAGRTIAEISIEHWVGNPPLSILADELDDLEKVIAELKKALA